VSGHSKWATIKRKKGANDAKRGQIFTRLGKEITIAARDGGSDPNANPALRAAIQNARGQNMPNDNIERAIKRGTGELEGVTYEEVAYEGYGPGGVAILVNAFTDNTNRTAAEVRHVFNKYGGKMAGAGSVSYLFSAKGVILVDEKVATEERILEVVIDAGAEDVETDDGVIQITAPRESFHAVLAALEEAGIETQSAELTYVPETTVEVEGKEAAGLLRLISILDDLDDIRSISANFDIAPEELATSCTGPSPRHAATPFPDAWPCSTRAWRTCSIGTGPTR
jgi:YebC/PmpR family DNA-binding regulatory protein